MNTAMAELTHQMILCSIISFVAYLLLTALVVFFMIQNRQTVKDLEELRIEAEENRKYIDAKKETMERLDNRISALSKEIEQKKYELIDVQNRYVVAKRLLETYARNQMIDLSSDKDENPESGEENA